MRYPVTQFRRVAQLAAFVLAAPWLVMGFLRCPFGVPFVSCMVCPMTNCRGLWLFPWALAALVASQVALARSFCGWLCPLGFLLDAIGHPMARRGTVRREGMPAPHRRRWRRLIGGAALGGTAAAVLLFNRDAGRAFDYVVRSPRLLDLEAVRVGTALGLWRYPFRIALLAAILLTGIFLARAWCRYLCPLGVLLALAKPVSRWRLGIHPEACQACGACLRVCPTATLPDSPDCIACFACADRCPKEAVDLKSGRTPGDGDGDGPPELARPRGCAWQPGRLE